MGVLGDVITLFLMDGSASGRVRSTLANAIIVGYKIPRTELEKCKELKELQQSGVYFLFGISDETGEAVVYVGKAGLRGNGEGILLRLQEHKGDVKKGYWTEAVVLSTVDGSHGSTEIGYLESRFCELTKKADRYKLQNVNLVTPGSIRPDQLPILERFIEHANVVMGTLGHKIFEPIAAPNSSSDTTNIANANSEDTLFIFQGNDAEGNNFKAEGYRTNDGFVVLKGAVLSPTIQDSCYKNARYHREGKYKDKIENNILNDSVLLSSPTAAAAFVGGANRNGKEVWVTKDGKTLREIEDSKNKETMDDQNSTPTPTCPDGDEESSAS